MYFFYRQHAFSWSKMVRMHTKFSYRFYLPDPNHTIIPFEKELKKWYAEAKFQKYGLFRADRCFHNVLFNHKDHKSFIHLDLKK
jgi:hypothetical protein